MDWTTISSDPNNLQAILSVATHFNSMTKTFNGTKLKLVEKQCRGKVVLDIGASGHNPAESIDLWPHEKLRKVSSSITGIDIDHQSCLKYAQMDYAFYQMDATSDGFLGKVFDRIYCGDYQKNCLERGNFLN